VTLYIADIASYQQGLTLSALRAAGFDAVNVKVSHGIGRKAVHPDVAGWVRDARAAGMGVSTFHWLDSTALGADQAAYAYQRIVELGGPAGMAHVVDVEATVDPPSQAHYRDYVTTMTRLLGRPICTYTGDWWWVGHGWTGKTPWVWAAPNGGYLPAYPGDTSVHWAAGYGGWEELAVMQHRVAEIAGVRVSQSAVRDPAIWAAMTGVSVTAAKLNHRAARALMLQHLDMHPGRTVHADLDPLEAGIVGDTDHADGGDSYHLGKDQIRPTGHRYSVDESARDRRGLDDYASAMDFGYFKVATGRGTFDLYDYNAWLVGLCRAGDPDTVDLREVIYSPDGQRVLRFDREGVRSTGDDSHLEHTHHSEYRDADGHRMLRLVTRWLQHIGLIPEEDDVSAQDVIDALKSKAGQDALTAWATTVTGRKALGDAVWAAPLVDPLSMSTPPATKTAGTYQRYPDVKHNDTRKVVTDAAADMRTGIDAVYQRIGALGDLLGSFNDRERDEVPITLEQLVQALHEAIPDDTAPLTAEQARDALFAVMQRAFTTGQPGV
jgi:hypothetical protein